MIIFGLREGEDFLFDFLELGHFQLVLLEVALACSLLHRFGNGLFLKQEIGELELKVLLFFFHFLQIIL